MNELWKWVTGFEGKYKINNLGNIKTFNIPINHKRYGTLMRKNKYPNGYEYINFKVNGIRTTHLIHRLVAIEFIENPNNHNVVNHIDSIRDNNYSYNLEWVTQSDNIIHGYKNNPNARSYENYRKGASHSKSIKVNMYTLNNEYLRSFDSIRIASNYLVKNNIANNNNCESSIRAVINKKQKTAYGYVWEKEKKYEK